MPLYEYECEACGNRFEVIQKFSDPPVEECRLCAKRPVRRLLSSPAIQFKGTGWYITDYAQKGKSDGTKEKSSGEKKDEKKTDGGGAAETKSDSSTASSPSTSTPSSESKK
jgi:putative FmdB family regulatory protein